MIGFFTFSSCLPSSSVKHSSGRKKLETAIWFIIKHRNSHAELSQINKVNSPSQNLSPALEIASRHQFRGREGKWDLANVAFWETYWLSGKSSVHLVQETYVAGSSSEVLEHEFQTDSNQPIPVFRHWKWFGLSRGSRQAYRLGM